MSSSINKLSVSLLVLVIAFICSAQASCWRYGHSCWGGHGKRSGRLVPAMAKSSESRADVSGRLRIPVELQLSESPVLPGDGTGADELIVKEEPSLKSMRYPYTSHDGELREKLTEDKRSEEVDDRMGMEYSESGERADNGQRIAGSVQDKRTHSAEIFIGFPRTPSDGVEPLAIATSEDNIKRATGDLSTRKFPLENFNLYKLVRILRRK